MISAVFKFEMFLPLFFSIWIKQMKVIRMLSGISSLQILVMSIIKCILNQEQLVR